MFIYKLKKKIKEKDRLSDILRYFYIPIVIGKKIAFNVSAICREHGFVFKSKYYDLTNYKDIHRGKRCFIIATGPSLCVEDLNKLKNEISFSMNSIYTSYNETGWRPTYYGIQDPFVYEKIKNEIYEEEYKAVFIGSIIAEKFPIKVSDKTKLFSLDLLWQQIPNKRYHTKFSSNIYSRIYSGYNIAYSMLQIAVYMGFKEIYLVGADCDYLQDKKYFMNDKNRGEEKHFTKKFYEKNTDKFILAYQVAKQYADANGIEIFNATRGGKLEVFPRVDLDSVLNT